MNEINNWIIWPRKVSFLDLLITTAWWFISWVVWSLLLLVIMLFFWTSLDIWNSFKSWSYWAENEVSSLVPIMLSFITFVVSLIVSGITYYFLTVTDPNRYKRTVIHYWQIAFFSLIIYIFLTPLYIYWWLKAYSNIMIVFLVHNIILWFGIILLLELLNNYRYILIWFYWSFIWLFITSIITFFLFSYFWWDWYAKLVSLLIILPLINWSIVFFKWIFEMIYNKYYSYFWMDQLWDIFRQIEIEESQTEREQFIKNNY